MKKVLAVLLALLLALTSLAACGTKGGTNGNGETQGTNGEEETSGENTGTGEFRVGFARVNITPEGDKYPLAGYGRTQYRLSSGFLDYILMSCIAFEDAAGTRFLMYSVDIIAVANLTGGLLKKVSEEFGIPSDHILVVATHTHSMVATSDTQFDNVVKYNALLETKSVEAAGEALNNLAPAKMYWNTVDLTGYNFVRHYFGDTGMAIGDNHNSSATWGAGTPVRHATEGNHEMYMVKIARENAEDILLCNWRAHPTITGGSAKTDISSDFVGAIRTPLEKELGCYFAYFQGEAGNQNPRTRLSADLEKGAPTDYKQYGKEVAERIATVYAEDTWEEIPSGSISTIREEYAAPANHSMDSKVGVAKEINSVYQANGWTDEVTAMLKEEGLYSPYQAEAIISNAGRAQTIDVPLHATRIGDLLISNEKSEMFDTNGNYVRDNSPSKYTLIMSYTEGNGYIPSQEAYEYGCYEADTTHYAPGTGELLAKRLSEMLNELWK